MKKTIIYLILAVLILSGCKPQADRTDLKADTQEAIEVTQEVIEVAQGAKQLIEKKVILPLEDNDQIKGFIKDKEGNWILYGNEGRICKSTDEGMTWEAQDNEKLKEWIAAIGKEKKVNMKETRMSESGNIIVWTTSYEREEPQGEDIWGEQTIDYFYENHGKEPEMGTITFSPQEYLTDICLTENGEVYGLGGGKVYRINLKEARKETLFETKSGRRIVLKEELIIVPDTDKVYIYDCKKNEMQEEPRELNTFMRRQKGNITFASGEGNSLYILCKSGLYRYILGGSSIEMVSDAKRKVFATMSETSEPLLGIAKPGMIFVSPDSKNLYFYSDKEVNKIEKTTIRLYRLQEDTLASGFYNQDLEFAIAQYEELNPQINIELETGMSAILQDNALKTEDVIKNLNMEIAAGQGSDILILDGLSAKEYQEKGVFEDISDIIEQVDADEGLLPNIVKHYREEDGSIYKIPLGFTVNILWMPKELLKESLTLEGLADTAEYVQNSENIEWELMSFPLSREQIEILAPTCMKAWIDEDSGINVKELSKFYEMSEKIFAGRANKYKVSPKYLERIEAEPDLKLETFIKEIEEEEMQKYLETNTARSQRSYLRYKNNFLEASILESGGNLFNRILMDTNSYNLDKNDNLPLIDFDIFTGQTGEKLFIPKKTAAINSASENKEEAKKFLLYLISEESNFGLHNTSCLEDGSDRMLFSINKRILEKDVKSASTITRVEDKYRANTEQIAKINKIIESLEAPSVDNTTLLNAVIEEGVKVIWKDLTAEEAANKVARKMELYLAE